MKKEDERKASSPDQHMVWALFHIVKRAWHADQRERFAHPEPPGPPVPGQGWFADPATLPIQLSGISPPDDAGTSVKIDQHQTQLSEAFRPRPFLIVSNEYLLDQKRAWVCPLSSSVRPRRGEPLPEWVIPLPELRTYCLASKLHTIDTEFFDDVAKRDLLHPMSPPNVLGEESARKVRGAIRKYLAGAFAPTHDLLPPGSIIRYPDGSERLVLASCDLGKLYRGGHTLTTSCRISRSNALDSLEHPSLPGVVPLPAPPSSARGGASTTRSAGFLDLGHVASENQSRLLRRCVGRDLSILATAHAAFHNLLMGEEEDGR